MSTQQLKTAVGANALAASQPKTFPELLEKMKPEIARALPKHLNADRMSRIALTEFRKNPKLGDCNLQTVFGAIITLSQLGLEPGVLGQAYLIPYKGTCTAVPGWQGYADLVARGGRASIWTGAVFQGDEFDYGFGDRPFITHKPSEAELPTVDRLTHCYAVGRIKGSDWPVIEVWGVGKIRAHRDRFNKVGNQHYSFQHFEMYGRKVALLQVIKYMPKSVELQMVTDLERAGENGQTIDVKAALDGSWTLPEAPTNDQTQTGGGEVATPDPAQVQSALRSLDEAGSTLDMEKAWGAIRETFRGSGIPLDVEARHNDRAEAIRQIEARASADKL